MYRTFSKKLHNGKHDDHSETLYITIQQTHKSWCYMVAWEINSGGLSYTACGSYQIKDWYSEIKDAIVDNIIGTQTVIDPGDVDDFLKSEEGSWLVSFTPEDFADENWKEWGN